jgi:hypothetical protein
MQRNVDCHTRAKLSIQVFPRGSAHDLILRKVGSFWELAMKKSHRNKNFIRHFDRRFIVYHV